nr:unnamed protein product [Callosobruchus analis]
MCLLYAAIFLSYFINSFQCEFSHLQHDSDVSIGSNVSVSDLPPIFHIDENYEKCKEQGKLFCKQTICDPRSYNHNELFQANMHLKTFFPAVGGWKGDEVDSLKPHLSQCYTEKYKHLELVAQVSALKCSRRDIEYQAGILDYSILSVVIFIFSLYVGFIIYASHLDYKIQFGGQRKARVANGFTNRYVVPFSVIANWQKLVKSNSRHDPQRLRCIQGIRFYNMLLIILCHTYSSYIGGYVKNTEYFEEAPKSLIHICMRNLFVFLVQTFFLFSGFLLSYHLFQLIEDRRTFSIRCIILTFVNRYLRYEFK